MNAPDPDHWAQGPDEDDAAYAGRLLMELRKVTRDQNQDSVDRWWKSVEKGHTERLTKEVKTLLEQIDRYNFCESHRNTGGHFGGCLECGMMEFSRALAEIDVAADPAPNDMGVTTYTLDCDPAGVVERVKTAMRRQQVLKDLVKSRLKGPSLTTEEQHLLAQLAPEEIREITG